MRNNRKNKNVNSENESIRCRMQGLENTDKRNGTLNIKHLALQIKRRSPEMGTTNTETRPSEDRRRNSECKTHLRGGRM